MIRRKAKSVLPIFVGDDRGRPERIASCVLVEVEGLPFVVTAAHALLGAQSFPLYLGGLGTGKILELPGRAAFTTQALDDSKDHFDLAVIPVVGLGRELFQNLAFLNADEVDENDEPSATDDPLSAEYLVLGYSIARSHVRVEPERLHVRQSSFILTTYRADLSKCLKAGINADAHIALDYNPKEIVAEGKRITPPKLKGLSGCGVFRCRWLAPDWKLTSILIEHRKQHKVIVATRITHALSLARDIVRRGDFFYRT